MDTLNATGNGASTLNVAETSADVAVAAVAAGKGKGTGKGKGKGKPQSGAPDYANMSAADLLSSYWGYVKNPLSDAATVLINTIGEKSAGQVKGELAGLVAVGTGLRKAYGRGIKTATVATDLNATIPDGFNPTFALYLSAARLRPDDANERKIASEVKSAIRAKIRTQRKGS